TPQLWTTLFPYTTLFRSVGLCVHEGVRLGRCGARAAAAVAAGVPLAPGVRAPLDELRTGHRTGLSGRGWSLRRTLPRPRAAAVRSEEHTSELQSLAYLVC